MIPRQILILLILLAGLFPKAGAAQDVSSLLEGTTLIEVSATLRSLILQRMPPVLHEAAPNWGQTTELEVLRWKGQGFKSHPAMVKIKKNHGTWRRIKITPRSPAQTLVFELRNLQQPAPDRLTFQVHAAMEADVDFEQWHWQQGVRLYSGSVRARLRGLMNMTCELAMRTEATGTYVPNLVFRVRVLQANSSYDNLVVEHIGGLGGTSARLLGEAIRGSLKQMHPSIERDLLAKANAAVIKAGDFREVRISLSNLLKLKKI